MSGAARLLAEIQRRGSDAKDLRDAAHEACHALEWKVTKKWTRDNIHARKPKGRSEGLRSEILARAVEQLEQRWTRVRKWAASQIKADPAGPRTQEVG